MGSLGGLMRSLLIVGAVLVTTDFIHGLYSLNRPYWYYKEDSELYNGGRRSRRSPHNPHNIYRRQADLEVPSAMLYPHCQVWSQENYRTFDGLMYVSDSACEVMLLQVDEMFSINSINDPNCGRPISGDCTRKVKFDFLFDVIDPIYLLPESEGGGAVRGGEQLSLPFYDSTLGIVIIPMNNYIVVELGHYGLSLIYDCQNYISIVVLDTSLIEGMVTGLCGDLDDDPSNDLIHRYGLTTETESISFYTNSWIVGECDGEPDVPLCTEIVSGLPLLLDPTTSERKASAEAQCDYLKDESVFGPCHNIEGLNVQEYVDACYADVCAMDEDSLDGASCSSIAAYVQECSRHFGGAPGVDWRTETICPYTCPEGLVYMPCPSACNDNSCNSVLHCDIDNNMGCIEGCRCPEGQFMKDGVCTSKDECPCEHLGESIPAGSTIEDDCNTCECSAGKLQCTTDICPATCSISGDPHFKTFDNKQFNFQGDCMYTLLTDCWNSWDYDTEYAIRAENTICGTRGYACIKAVTIEYGSKTVRLGRGHAVTLDGDIIDSFPHLIDDIYIDVATETTSVVHLGNGVSLIWDGINRLEIHVQPEHYNHTCGLCGTFTMNQNDDFYTAAGDTESNPQSFGNKWKYGSACKDVPIAGPLESCSINTQRRTVANDECSVLQSEAFSACHAKVSPTPYIDNCKIDVCSCKLKDDCHCAMIADYASECWRKGVQIDWRNVSSECGIEPCQAQGLRYTQCMDSCQSSCAARSFSSEYNCHNVCIEGCVCPEGQIRGMTGNCIKPDKCECVFEGELFMAGESRMERCGFCTCEKGGWTCELDEDCEDATCGENEEFVACLSPCPKTCNNVNNYEGCYIAYDNCTSGCQCQGDKMLHNGKCIPISSCPCYHGGLTYQVADKVKQKACRECTCSDEGWNCVTLDHCIGSCVAWGDPHFKTFDSKTYDFQGDCEYILAETVSGAAVAPFHIIIKSIPCGSSGVTCTKSIALTIGDPQDAETVFLVRGRDTPVTNFPFSNFRVESVGSYVFVFTQIGITLMWDKGTFLEVQIAPHFKGQVQGLCGNYDDNADNDFMTRSGGKASDDPILFSNGWKVHDYCADPPSIEDACDLNPHRRAWAYRRCNELRSDRFKLCHAKVDVAEFYKKCVFDACGCDMGGDCDCLCTAIAAYAYECNKFGVPVEWRRQDVCPIQCEECERYDPCISPCEYDCDLLDLGDGSGECNYTCVEGCTCPPGQYYRDGECVQDCEVYTTTPLPTTTKLTTTLETTTEVVTTPPPSTTVETTTPKITTPPIPSTSPRTSPVSSTPPSPTEIFTTPVPSTTSSLSPTPVSTSESPTPGPTTTSLKTTGSQTPTPGPTSTFPPESTAGPTTSGPTPTGPLESTTGPTASGPTPTGPPESTAAPTTSGPTPTGPPGSTTGPTTSGPTPTGPPESTAAPTTSGPTPTGPPGSTTGPTASGPTPTGPVGSTTGPTASGPTPTGPPGSTTGPTVSGPTPTGPPGSTTGPTASGPTPTGPPESTAGPTTSGPTPTGPPGSTAGPTTSTSPPETTTVLSSTTRIFSGGTVKEKTPPTVTIPVFTEITTEETTPYSPTQGLPTPQIITGPTEITQPKVISTVATTGPLCYKEVCEYSEWRSDEQETGSEVTDKTFTETELLTDLEELYDDVCANPRAIECRIVGSEEDYSSTGEEVHCDTKEGLRCINNANTTIHCSDYEIRVECCKKVAVPCTTPPISAESTTSESTTSLTSASTEVTTGFETATPGESTEEKSTTTVQSSTTVKITSPFYSTLETSTAEKITTIVTTPPPPKTATPTETTTRQITPSAATTTPQVTTVPVEVSTYVSTPETTTLETTPSVEISTTQITTPPATQQTSTFVVTNIPSTTPQETTPPPETTTPVHTTTQQVATSQVTSETPTTPVETTTQPPETTTSVQTTTQRVTTSKPTTQQTTTPVATTTQQQSTTPQETTPSETTLVETKTPPPETTTPVQTTTQRVTTSKPTTQQTTTPVATTTPQQSTTPQETTPTETTPVETKTPPPETTTPVQTTTQQIMSSTVTTQGTTPQPPATTTSVQTTTQRVTTSKPTTQQTTTHVATTTQQQSTTPQETTLTETTPIETKTPPPETTTPVQTTTPRVTTSKPTTQQTTTPVATTTPQQSTTPQETTPTETTAVETKTPPPETTTPVQTTTQRATTSKPTTQQTTTPVATTTQQQSTTPQETTPTETTPVETKTPPPETTTPVQSTTQPIITTSIATTQETTSVKTTTQEETTIHVSTTSPETTPLETATSPKVNVTSITPTPSGSTVATTMSLSSTEQATSTATTATPTPPETTCTSTCAWTDWCDDEGHGKRIFKDEVENKVTCKKPICEKPDDIQCVTSLDEIPYTNFRFTKCDLDHGFYCNASTIGFCMDFKVRYYCCSPCVTPATTVVTTPVQTTSPPTTVVTTTEEITSITIPPTTSITTAETTTEEVTTTTEITTAVSTQETPCVRKCEWTDWCDDEDKSDKSGKPIFGNEVENKDTCKEPICDEPTKIECVSTLDGIPSSTFPGTKCDLDYGFYCDESAIGFCVDFKVRYYCCSPCVAPPTTVVTSTPTSAPTTVATTTEEITSITIPPTTSITTAQTTTEEVTTTEEITTTTEITTAASTQETPCIPYCNWTDWCDGEGHGKPIFEDEVENKDNCKKPVCDEPTKIECVTTLDELPSSLFQETTCDLNSGLYCDASAIGLCPDFKIRYYCCTPCVTQAPEVSTTPVRTTVPTSPPTTLVTTTGEITSVTVPHTTNITTATTFQTTTAETTTAETTTSKTSTAETTAATTAVSTQEPCLPCEIHHLENTTYEVDGCITEPISLPICGGSCPSSYSYKKSATGVLKVDQSCSCCTRANYEERQVKATCTGGPSTVMVEFVTACSCKASTCTV